NMEVFASDNPNILEELKANADILFEKDVEAGNVLYQTLNVADRYFPGNLILTDDRAPVEVLGMRGLDEIIQKEIRALKEAYQIHTLKDIWELWRQ
ncbi:hypothetical protein, partial [Bacillus licheniformis]|uniref:hypothetical protein n=1 Tax=Bacillus licheniformis TaxID=1402 RepID=UPI0040638EBA